MFDLSAKTTKTFRSERQEGVEFVATSPTAYHAAEVQRAMRERMPKELMASAESGKASELELIEGIVNSGDLTEWMLFEGAKLFFRTCVIGLNGVASGGEPFVLDRSEKVVIGGRELAAISRQCMEQLLDSPLSMDVVAVGAELVLESQLSLAEKKPLS